jgi:hypothetical protein
VLIQRTQLIAGRQAVEVRDLMRMMGRTAHSTGGLAAALNVSVSEATRLTEDLRSGGLIEVVETHSGPYMVGRDEDRPGGDLPRLWLTTISGNALAKARIGKPMSRADAQTLCDDVVARAREVNASDDWLHWVIELSLYGSFSAPGDGPVGDIDLAVHLQRRYEDDDYMRRNEDMIDVDGARPQTIIDVLSYADVKVLRHLRGRSPRVDLIDSGPRCRGLPPGVTLVPLYQFSPTPTHP